MIRDCSPSHQAHIFQEGILVWTAKEHAVESYQEGLHAAYTEQMQRSREHWQNLIERLADTVGAKR